MDVKSDKVYTAVVFTDGSAGPRNPGPYGGGCHGYLFTEEDFKKNGDKPKNYTVTSIGYLEKHELSDDTVVVKPSLYYNAVYPYGKYGTNNQAELTAVADTIRILTSEYTISNIIIFTDSTYTMSVHKVVENDLVKREWLLSDRPNLEMWETLADALTKAGDTKIELRKIKAHGTAIGNNTADRLAFAAREMGSFGITKEIYKFYEGKYWTDKPVPHPLLNFKQVYFNVGIMPDTDEHLYAVMEYPAKVECGKKSPEPIYGVTVAKSPVPDLNRIINVYHSYTRGTQFMSAIDLRVLNTQNHLKYSELLGDYTYSYDKSRRLNVMGEDNIVTPILPPGLAQNALSKTLSMYKIYRRYLDNNGDDDGVTAYIDITDQLYDTNAKGKLVFKFDQQEVGPKINLTLDNKELELTLGYGTDTLSCNQFKKLGVSKPKIVLALVRHNEGMLEYYSIIISDEMAGIYSNFYINKIWL
jgi:ribonuclease HI